MLVMMGGALFQPLIGMLLDANWNGQIQYGIHVYSTHDYQFALCVLPIALLIGTIFSLFLPETHIKLQ